MSRAQQRLVDLADSDSDDGFTTRAAIYSSTTDEMPAVKKPRGRPAANRVTKPATAKSTRQVSGRVAAAAEREALAEKAEVVPPKATRGSKATAKKATPEEDEEDVLATPPQSDEPKKTKGRGRPKAGAKEIPDSVQRKPAVTAAKRGRKPLAAVDEAAGERSEIPETQPYQQAMDIDEDDEMQDQVEDLPTYTRTVPASAQRVQYYTAPFSASKRPTSSSDHDSDPSLRRRLGEMTKKYESLELKYRDLREVAVREAESNFDKLKKQSEEKTKAANELIASLKKDLAAQKELAKNGQQVQKRLDTSEAKVDSLQAQITEITTSLSESKSEIKALTTKLSAARAGEAQATANAARIPGSAMKASVMGSRKDGLQVGIQATQTAKMKEDLYSDLTGLIVTGIKRDGPEDVYDCIQTGRNGTLHFKLSIANENSADNYEDAQFMYMPQLDDNRDNKLIELLPDYLVEEITFPRPHAAKFYARVQKSLTERPE